MTKHFSRLIVAQAILLASLSVAGANTRLAIGTFGLVPDKRDAALADLVAATLSAVPELELVERRELDAVLKEASLSLSGLVRAKDAVRVGALLRADQFLLGNSLRIDGTNSLIIRLVDAKTGAIRGINVFRDSPSLDALAEDVVKFVREEVKRPSQEHRDYLALGVIQNLGVNNRFSDFPAEMRAYVAVNLSGKVKVLERDVISFLANEVRLDMAGLTEGNGRQIPEMQFGFWIVDGFYQSYELADPEVQLKLRVERVLGGHQNYNLQGKPNKDFFRKICDSIIQTLEHPEDLDRALSPSRQGEIAALEARAQQLADYERARVGFPSIQLRSPSNPDRVMNTLAEVTRVFESILLLDPDNNAAKMRLAACLRFNAEGWGGVARTNKEEREARAQEYYREVIATGDPENGDDARISLADSHGGLKGVEMLHRFGAEAREQKARERFQFWEADTLQWLTVKLPIETLMPYFRKVLFEQLKQIDENAPVTVDYGSVLFPYRYRPLDRERILNELLPDLLHEFPRLEPYFLLAAAGEQCTTNSPVTAQFLASLKRCEEHPDAVLQPKCYFSQLSSTLEEEQHIRTQGGTTLFQRTFDNHQHATVINMALARQKAAGKGLAPPLTNIGKKLLAESYLSLKQWKEALEIFEGLPDTPVETKNECRKHLGTVTEAESVPDSAWKDKTDTRKIEIAYECMGRGQWSTALSIFELIGHRTVNMASGGNGPWGYAFTPVLPAVLAAECRTKAGKPKVSDPMLFEIGEMPYVHFTRDGNERYFSFEAEDEDLWLAVYSRINRFRGPGPFAAGNPPEVHELQRTTRTANTCICVSPHFVWAGTEDDGLLELNRKTGVCRRLTMNDGLLLNGISCLYLQGQTLWIGYKNGENGAVGTMNLATHRFSSFTPKLSSGAGTNSQPSYIQSISDDLQQAPQHPIYCMTEVEPGEMWFAVAHKGLQRYRNSDTSWLTIGRTNSPITDPAYTKRAFRRGYPFTSLSSSDTPLTAMAADSRNGRILLAALEIGLDNERSVSGGLVIYDYRHNRQDVMQIYEGLPSNDVSAVASDGRIAWVGGRGFVAVVDMQERKVLRIAYVSASRIRKIQLTRKHAWIQVSCGEMRAPDYAGNAWTGVYRVERAAVEPAL